jgi:hypothetical protein
VWIGGIGLLPISGLWMLSGNTGYLLLVQFAAGVAWAAYELGTFLMIWETVAEGERTSIMTTFNLANAGANTSGALIGGQILGALGKDLGAYQTVFALSLAVRLATLILLLRLQHSIAASSVERGPAPAPDAQSQGVADAPADLQGARVPLTRRRAASGRRAGRAHAPGQRR